MLRKRDLVEMRVLTDRVRHGSVSREDWANLAALTLIFEGDATVVAIAAQGLDAFIRVAKPVYDGHAFQHDDYRRIYQRLCAAAMRVARDTVPS